MSPTSQLTARPAPNPRDLWRQQHQRERNPDGVGAHEGQLLGHLGQHHVDDHNQDLLTRRPPSLGALMITRQRRLLDLAAELQPIWQFRLRRYSR